ncbi:hypothetical protein C900_03191 [Fulvivirga imtechensis AK7]|uniref:Uncharacterized protein n=1 Tax=Fulvivirga imtechensis AK7 TaxID=1237149 RepID=L8JQ25_9BACT|nr:hypothetical protein [Fulvivirga imtechensis]ELR71061.1 hypothetical protein C900_03191 [Fulvivirga imtechensis AK7]
MIEANTYRGIDYVRVGDLPNDQKEAIQNWLNEDVVIKIQTETALLSDCILYKDYQHWFEKIFTSIVPVENEKVKPEFKTQANPVGTLALANPKHR